VYCAWNIIKDDAVAIKLESITHSSSVQHEYNILKHLEGGVGIPCALWFGRESTYHTLILDLLGPSLHSLFLSHSHKFSLDTVINLGDQLVSRCKEHRIYLLILRSYRLESQCSNHHIQSACLRTSCLSPHTGLPLVLADLLVSYLTCYGSVHFGPECAPYI
jgi:hypothetical protein